MVNANIIVRSYYLEIEKIKYQNQQLKELERPVSKEQNGYVCGGQARLDFGSVSPSNTL